MFEKGKIANALKLFPSIVVKKLHLLIHFTLQILMLKSE